ncbi:methyltransferase domain-containing protein [Emticicia sp. CRIBPO]|uniref:class I SAM-dependent methyltransferase n=1 Tax=Emticicia sp. CRIBPO TaxID=2683258 RepID=UPI0014137915|nr:class I SAM-dependent methyltransferase [Emticicia sp. CRIBPO]NBA86062.1 methyltransferase domain-containing protein [Emticicia sp. CRIBPO]
MEKNSKPTNIPHSRKNAIKFIYQFLEQTNVNGKLVIDLSAGKGFVASLWKKNGAEVRAFDLYPELMENDEIFTQKIDLNKIFPIESGCADYVLLMETIDHISEQKQLFDEIARILKPGGCLVLTKPNNSNISGRIANLWLESERGDMLLPNEKSVIGYDENRIYMGRIFLIGIQKIRTLAALAGLRIEKIYPNQFSVSSLLYFLLFGCFFYIRTYLTFKRLSKKQTLNNKKAIEEQYKLNQNPLILFQKHLCVILKKVN